MRLLAKQGPVPTDTPIFTLRFRVSPTASARQGAGESNAVLKVWSLLGRHGLHPVALRTRIELVSFLRQRNCDTSRITKQLALPEGVEPS
jgi:hypothetical protein